MLCEHSVRWLYRLARAYAWESGLAFDRDYAFKDKKGRVRLVLERGGRMTITRGYAWNGCSPKVCFLDLLLGTPDGVVDARTGRPKTYHATLVHDALYQFLGDGLPLTRAEADRCFLRLLDGTGFRPRYVYYAAVRLFGGLAREVTRRVRDWRGRPLPI
jgi:hypothetical protein